MKKFLSFFLMLFAVVAANAQATFDLKVTNGTSDNVIEAGATAEKLSWYFYAAGLPEGFQINRDNAAVLKKDGAEFNTAQAGEMDATTGYWSFRNAAPDYITESGVYTLEIPAGVFFTADAEGNVLSSSNAATFTWTIAAGAEKTPFDIAAVSMNWMGESIAAGSEVSALSYMYQIDTDKELSAGEGRIEFKDAQGNGIGVGELAGNYIRFMNFGETGYTTPGTYTLVIPAGAVVDAEGNPCNEFSASWTVKSQAEAGSFAIESIQNGQNEGTDVDVLSYMFTITAANAITALGEGNITLTDAEGTPVGGNAYVFGYEGEGGSKTVYARFAFDTDDHQLHTAGAYTLNVPAGMFVDAEGNKNEAFNATWTVTSADSNVINIESVEVGSVVDDKWGTNDVKYTVTMKLAKPEGAAYAYSEGLLMTLNGESTGVPFTFGDYGMLELEGNEDLTLVYVDNMLASTDDADFEGDFRAPGSYVGTTEIYFMDEFYNELSTVAKFTGSVVLPNLNEVTVGNPTFNVEADPFFGKITLGELESNGLKMELTDAAGITPDMTIKAVATLSTITRSDDEVDPGFTAPEIKSVLSNVEFTGDAMFGTPVVNFTEFVQYIAEAGADSYMIQVSSIEVMNSTGVVASWKSNPVEGDVLVTAFEVIEQLVLENVTAKVGQTEANEWGDQHYTVDVTVPAEEFAGLGVAFAYTEGVIFEAWNDEEATMEYFTFNANALEGVEVTEGEDIVMTCTDSMVSQTSDTTYEGDLRAEGTYPASCIIVLCDENFATIGTAEFRGELTLNASTATGIKNVTFKASDATYNIAGQKVNANAKGLVIKNGKVYLQK